MKKIHLPLIYERHSYPFKCFLLLLLNELSTLWVDVVLFLKTSGKCGIKPNERISNNNTDTLNGLLEVLSFTQLIMSPGVYTVLKTLTGFEKSKVKDSAEGDVSST